MKQMQKLKSDLCKFVKDRNWQNYHSPKNLAMALSVEVAELVEIFQWLTEDESYRIASKAFIELKDEIGDVQIYLTMLADKFNLNPIDEANAKLKKNKKKYPVMDNQFNKFL